MHTCGGRSIAGTAAVAQTPPFPRPAGAPGLRPGQVLQPGLKKRHRAHECVPQPPAGDPTAGPTHPTTTFAARVLLHAHGSGWKPVQGVPRRVTFASPAGAPSCFPDVHVALQRAAGCRRVWPSPPVSEATTGFDMRSDILWAWLATSESWKEGWLRMSPARGLPGAGADGAVHPAQAPRPAGGGGAAGHRRGGRHPIAAGAGHAGALPRVPVLHRQWL